MRHDSLNPPDLSIGQKFWYMHWTFIFLLCVTASVGFAMLYSAANGDWQPWAYRQMIRFGVGMVIMLAVAVTDIRFWLKYAYLFYGIAFAMLVAVEIMGSIGMGAQRWLDLGFFNVQPSELMKITLVLALARYFHGCSIEDVGRISYLIIPLMMTVAPFGLVLIQPDLGTALMLLMASAAIFFLAGVKVWKFYAVGIAGLAALPIGWQFLRPYQKQRVLTFLNPEQDPLGSGYHIIQSKIALGSGGMFGRGFLQGSQSHLSFLPEKQTDFIFTMLAEEFGFMGAATLIVLYLILLLYGFFISTSCQNQFGRLVGMGIVTTFFLYIFINIAMVMGVIPVVGVPLPLVSYGGTAMLTLMIGFGLLLSVHVHGDVMIGRRATGDD